MPVRYPAPLQPGDRVGVPAPSSGVPDALVPRLQAGLRVLERCGLEAVLGRCLDGSGVVSAPAEARAEELAALLLDPSVRAVVPPQGGELAVEVLPLLPWLDVVSAPPGAGSPRGRRSGTSAAPGPTAQHSPRSRSTPSTPPAAGGFDVADAVLVGRTSAPDADGFSQLDVVRSALQGLDLPVVLDVDCGHVPPHLSLMNGALAELRVDAGGAQLVQHLAP